MSLFPVVFAVLYILFNIYLVIHMAANMGNQALLNSTVSALTLAIWLFVSNYISIFETVCAKVRSSIGQFIPLRKQSCRIRKVCNHNLV